MQRLIQDSLLFTWWLEASRRAVRRPVCRNYLAGYPLAWGDSCQIRLVENDREWYPTDPEYSCPRCTGFCRARTSYGILVVPQVSFCRRCGLARIFYQDEEGEDVSRFLGNYESIPPDIIHKEHQHFKRLKAWQFPPTT